MRTTYKKFLISKGYRYDKENDRFEKDGFLYKPVILRTQHFLKLEGAIEGADVSGLKITPSEVMDRWEIEKLDKALDLIYLFQIREYGGIKELSRFSSIPLAYTEKEEEGQEVAVSVYLDLIKFTLKTYVEGYKIEEIHYDSLDDVIKNLLSHMSFESLTEIPDGGYEAYMEMSVVGGNYIKRHDEKLKFQECLSFLSQLADNGLIQWNYMDKKNKALLIYHKAEADSPEGWYSDPLYDAAANLCESEESQRELWKVVEGEDFEPEFWELRQV